MACVRNAIATSRSPACHVSGEHLGGSINLHGVQRSYRETLERLKQGGVTRHNQVAVWNEAKDRFDLAEPFCEFRNMFLRERRNSFSHGLIGSCVGRNSRIALQSTPAII
jgi:hypothetical protein